MDRELIERLVVESGLPIEPWDIGDSISTKPAVMRFAALIAEECAKVCDEIAADCLAEGSIRNAESYETAAAAIREKFSV